MSHEEVAESKRKGSPVKYRSMPRGSTPRSSHASAYSLSTSACPGPPEDWDWTTTQSQAPTLQPTNSPELKHLSKIIKLGLGDGLIEEGVQQDELACERSKVDD